MDLREFSGDKQTHEAKKVFGLWLDLFRSDLHCERKLARECRKRLREAGFHCVKIPGKGFKGKPGYFLMKKVP